MEAPQIFTAAVASLTLVGVAIGRLPALKMNRATIALVGATVLLAGPAALIVAAYILASRKDIGSTTEMAAFVVLAAGVFAGSGHWPSRKCGTPMKPPTADSSASSISTPVIDSGLSCTWC